MLTDITINQVFDFDVVHPCNRVDGLKKISLHQPECYA